MTKIALVHDWLNQLGGAEDVLEVMTHLFPDAPIYTGIYYPEAMPDKYREWDIRTLWIDRLPGIHTHHQAFLPFYPLAFGELDLSEYEIVLSNKSGFCHGVHTGRDTIHICYCLTPTRYVWDYDRYVERERLNPIIREALRPLIALLRRWDRAAAQRVDQFIAISNAVRGRIKRFYGRDSIVIYPPVETDAFKPVAQHDDYYLVVSRLVPYKRIDLAVQACSELGVPLLIAGSGRDRERLEAMAGPTVRFLGWVPDSELPELMARCRALIFPGLEDFGITPVQAQAAGRPVIAFRGGGALDTVIEGRTGLFFDEQTSESLADAIRCFDPDDFKPDEARRNAMRFDRRVFEGKITEIVTKAGKAR